MPSGLMDLDGPGAKAVPPIKRESRMPSWVVGETMTHAMPWNVRGIDGDVREAAFEAARAAGMSVGQWLDHVIRDNARDLGIDVDEPRTRRQPRRDDGRRSFRREREAGPFDRPIRRERQADPFDQLAERLERIGRRDRATAPPPVDTADVRPEKIAKVIETAVDALERSARATEEKTASALQKVTQWIERTEADRAQELRPSARLAQDAALLRPLEDLGKKLQHIEDRLTQAQAQQSPPRVEKALAELEGKLTTIQRSLGEADKRQPTMPRELERTLQGLEQRMLHLAKSIEQKASEPKTEPGTAESVERIETKLATLLETLRQQAEAPAVATPAPSVPPIQPGDARRSLIERDLRGVIGEIAERQQHLDQTLDAGEAIDPSVIDTLRDDLAQVARRMDVLADGLRTADLAAFRNDLSRLDQSVAGLAERSAQMAASAVRDDLRVLSDQVQGLAPRHLVASIDHAVRDLADKIDDAKRDDHSRFNLAGIAELLQDVKAAVDEMREPAPLHDMAETLRGLAGRMNEAERFDAGALSRLQDETSEIKDLIRRSLERQALDPLENRIDAIGQRLEHLSAMPARDMTEELSRVRHDLISAMPSDALRRIEDRISSLASRLDDDTAPVGEGRSLDAISARLDMLTQRLEQTHAPDANVIGSLGERIERLQRSLESRQTQQGGQEFETLIRDLGQKIQAAPMGGSAEALLTRLQGEMERIALKLERGDVQVSSLASLERSIGDLFKLVDDLKGSTATTAERAARDALHQAIRHMEARLERGGDADVLDTVQREFGELKSAQKRAEDRTSETLAAVHQTLETLVGRLGQLEQRQTVATPRANAAPPAPDAVAAPASPKAKRDEIVPPAKAPALRDQNRSPISAAIAAARNAISAGSVTGPERTSEIAAPVEPRREAADASKPALPDLPLEPGSGRPSPSRLGAADPIDPKEFIARTRRAQQAAAQQTADAIAQRNGTDGKAEQKAPTRSLARSPKHVALLGLAVVAMGGVALTVANTMRNRVPATAPTPGAIERPAPKEEAAPATSARPEQRSDIAPLPAPRAETPPQRAAETVAAADPVVVGALDKLSTGSIAPRRPIADTEPLARFEGLTAPERLRVAALSGDPAAQYEIAARYSEGRGGVRNQQIARDWFQRAAEAGHVPSQYRLAGLFREGRGIEKNTKVALEWFQRAAERGHVRAMHNLAVMLAEGASGSPDYAMASVWFQRAAEFGVRDSQFNLAILTARGLGTSQDLVASYRWFDAAAKQGDDDSGKKRDEVGSRLSPDKLAEAKAAAAAWREKTPDPLVNDVAVPAGGWDAVPKQMPRPKTMPPATRT